MSTAVSSVRSLAHLEPPSDGPHPDWQAPVRREALEWVAQHGFPEIPINVVDLGLVYECDARPLADGGHRVEIKMSMTAPGCGMGDVLRDEARAKVLSVPGVREVDVELVWEPPWDLSRLSDAARLELGLL